MKLRKSEIDHLRTTVEDLEHLRSKWGDHIDDISLRHGSVLLRRLLIDGDFFKAWKKLNFAGHPYVVAPRVEYFLKKKVAENIKWIIAGGGQYKGVKAAFGILIKGERSPAVPKGIDPINHKFSLGSFVNSTSIYVDRVCISRGEIIKYVANKLGGAHFDANRDKPLGVKFRLLDENIDSFQIQHISDLKGKNAVYFELLSIGQLIGESPGVARLIERARQVLSCY